MSPDLDKVERQVDVSASVGRSANIISTKAATPVVFVNLSIWGSSLCETWESVWNMVTVGKILPGIKNGRARFHRIYGGGDAIAGEHIWR